jgi:hypothetical protein
LLLQDDVRQVHVEASVSTGNARDLQSLRLRRLEVEAGLGDGPFDESGPSERTLDSLAAAAQTEGIVVGR